VGVPYLLLARLLAAALNVAPPLVGSYALGRESYGMVASVLAIATITCGPIGVCLSQRMLRQLCTSQPAEPVVGGALLYALACMSVTGALFFAGTLSAPDALELVVLIVALTVLRVCEVQLISEGRVIPATLVFFAGPPTLTSACYFAAAAYGGGHAAGALAQSAGYLAAAFVGLATARQVLPLLGRSLWQPRRSAVELVNSYPLMATGAATVAAEFLPIVLLRGFGAFAVIPVYEIARKIASVPTTLANPLLNQTNPAIIQAYASGDRAEIRRLLKGLVQVLFHGQVLFLCLVAATLVAGAYNTHMEDVAKLLLPLSLGTLVAVWCIPYQGLLIAAHGDRWFGLASGVSVVLLLAITYSFAWLGAGMAVSWAVGVSVAANALIVRFRAMQELHDRQPRAVGAARPLREGGAMEAGTRPR
jgi:O-antigen/teichoic acid export membrane protein